MERSIEGWHVAQVLCAMCEYLVRCALVHAFGSPGVYMNGLIKFRHGWKR